MLENLINTKLKRKLLNIFFSFPKRSFSAHELRVMTESSMLAQGKAMKEFVRNQVVNVASRKQSRLYRINPHFHLYDELRDLITETEGEAEDFVVKQLKKISNLELAVLSGIFTLEPHLPADLLLVGNQINRVKLQQTLSEIKKITAQELVYSVMNEQEYEHRRLMNDRFVRDIFDNPHLVVINNLR